MPRGLLVIVLALVLGTGWWLLRTSQLEPSVLAPAAAADGDSDRRLPSAAAAGVVSESVSEGVRTSPPTLPTQRHDVAGSGATLQVRALWPDHSPAAGVHLFLREAAPGAPERDVAAATTDAAGATTFETPHAGRYVLHSDRDDRMEVTAVVGTQQVTITLAAGITVVGTVRDPTGRAVAGAGIWLQTARIQWDGGREVARSDARGEFVVAHMNPKCSLGAFAAGHGPSALVDLEQVDTRQEPVRVELVLGPSGGDLVGVVRDAAGDPVSGACIAAGHPPDRIFPDKDRVAEVWTPRTGISDAAGKFAIAGLPAGEVPVAVRAQGFGVWRGKPSIAAGMTTRIEVDLRAAATILGSVVDAQRRPVAGARISLYDQPPETMLIANGWIGSTAVFGQLRTTADAEGRFRLTGVAPGAVHAFAQPPKIADARARTGRSTAFAHELLEVAPGEGKTWNPVLADGNTVKGVVLYQDGQPMAGAFVQLTNEDGEVLHGMGNANDGTFQFVCLPQSTFHLRAQLPDAPKGAPPLERRGVQPNGEPVELRATFDKPAQLQPGAVVGRVDDAGRRVRQPTEVRVQLHSDQDRSPTDGALADGSFRFDGVAPGRYRVVLLEGYTLLAQSDWHQLQPAATIDIGALRTEAGGDLKVALHRGEGFEAADVEIYLRRTDDATQSVVFLGRSNEALASSLTPGDYGIAAYGGDGCPAEGRATVRAGETAEVRLRLLAGAQCRFEAWLPQDTRAAGCTYRIVASDGSVLTKRKRTFEGTPSRPFPVVVRVPPGDWRFQLDVDGGGRGDVAFAVRDTNDVQLRVDVH